MARKKAIPDKHNRKHLFLALAVTIVFALVALLYFSKRETDSDYLYVTFRCMDKRCNKGALRFSKEETKDFDTGDTTYLVTYWAAAEVEEDESTAIPDIQKGKKLFLSSTPDVSDPRFLDTLKIIILNISDEKPPVPGK